MRPIFFKGIRKDNGEWASGSLWCGPIVGLYKIVPLAAFCTCDGYDVHEHTICQYTGQRDSNKQRIYEGDIVKDEYGGLYIVVYIGATFMAVFQGKDSHLHSEPIDELECVVIGNIHDKEQLG